MDKTRFVELLREFASKRPLPVRPESYWHFTVGALARGAKYDDFDPAPYLEGLREVLGES